MSSADTASTLPSSDPSTNPSSNPTTDSSQSQGSTFDTQPPSSQEELETQAAPNNSWGQLTVISGGRTYDLVNNVYLVGRADHCHLQLTNKSEPTKRISLWKACSKEHFKVYVEMKSSGKYIFIEDLSTNGTIVNNELIGTGKFTVLKNGDVISLVKRDYKAYLFTETNAKEKNEGLPIEIRTRYMFVEDLGRGAFGEVKLAIRRRDKLRVACKCIEKNAQLAYTHSPRDLMKEVDIMKKLNHPCIIKVVDVLDTDSMFFILMDLVDGGDLLQAVSNNKRLDPDHAKTIFYQTCLAVQYLHNNNVVHRDLKPENILLTSKVAERQIVKVTDFGYSIIKATSSLLHTICGTSMYLAPELMQMACLRNIYNQGDADMRGYTKSVDCWSLGVILYVCITGQPAFTAQRTDLPFQEQILKGSFQLKDKYWEYLDYAKDIVKKLLTVDVAQRLTLDEALKHPYFQDKEMVDRVERLLAEERSSYTSSDHSSENGTPERPTKKPRLDEDTEPTSTCATPLLSTDMNTSVVSSLLDSDNTMVQSVPSSAMSVVEENSDMSTTS